MTLNFCGNILGMERDWKNESGEVFKSLPRGEGELKRNKEILVDWEKNCL